MKLLHVLSCLWVGIVGVVAKIGWKITDVPNPKTDPLGCGRLNVPHSSVCDPNKFMNVNQQNEVEGYLNAFTLAEIAVVIIDKMDLSSLGSRDIDYAAEKFARTLHNTYGVGSKEANNGILLFLSIQDRVVYISTGPGVEKKLSSEMIQMLIENMRPKLRSHDYGGAIATCITSIDLLLSEKGESMIRSYYSNRAKSSRSSSTGSGENNDGQGFIYILLVMGGILGFGIYKRRQDQAKLDNIERGRERLQRLLQDFDQANNAAGNGGSGGSGNSNKFKAKSCPICLEDFDPLSPSTAMSGTGGITTAAADETGIVEQ